MECDSAALEVVSENPPRSPFHVCGAAGGTNQRFLVPVCRDQYQRFGRTVLFDTPTSHGLPFRQGFMAQNWLLPCLNSIYRFAADDAKVVRPGGDNTGAEECVIC
jgi:hypothetical protein